MKKVLSPMDPNGVAQFEKNRGTKKTQTVCICGHSSNKHSNDGSLTFCTPGRMTCLCQSLREVIKTENLRLFQYTTTGFGIDHALGKGISACVSRETPFEWIEKPTLCDACLQPVELPIPVSVNSTNYQLSFTGGGIDKIVCENCFNRLAGLGETSSDPQ